MREVARSKGCKGKNRAKSSTGAGRQQVDAGGGHGCVRGRVEVEAGEGRREAQRRAGGESDRDRLAVDTERTTVPFLVFGSAFLYSKERWVTSSAVSSTLKAQTQGARHAREGMGKTWTL